MSWFKNSISVVLGLISIGVIIGVVLTTGFNIESRSHAEDSKNKIYSEPEAQVQSQQAGLTAANFNPNIMFVDMVKKVRPSIVSIYTEKNVKMRQNPFFRFFRDWGDMPDDQYHQPEMRQEGLGSGIIISADGYILTNYHVVHDMDELRVRLVDNTEYLAKIIGEDNSTEVALIKVDAENLPVAILGNSDKVQIGEWVMAIGSPLRLTSTVTAGIVSALGRDINIIQDDKGSGIENFIQTDAAINPGNSGGALVNLNGEVIGINTAIATQTRYYMGYGFAVPINMAKRVMDDLLEYGKFRRGYLGVRIEAVTPVIAKYLDLDKPKGVHVSSVMEGSAADKSGLREGDVVIAVNDVAVNQPNELQAKIGVLRPGDKVDLTVWRDKQEKSIVVVLATLEDDDIAGNPKPDKEREKKIPDLGIRVQDLSDQDLRQLKIDFGIVITSVDRYSAAGKARLFKGDIIYDVDGKEIHSASDFYDMISSYKEGDVVKLKVKYLQDRDVVERPVYLQIPK